MDGKARTSSQQRAPGLDLIWLSGRIATHTRGACGEIIYRDLRNHKLYFVRRRLVGSSPIGDLPLPHCRGV